MQKVLQEIRGKKLFVVIDETSDNRDCSVLNIVIGTEGKYYLTDVIFMDSCNYSTVSQAILQSLHNNQIYQLVRVFDPRQAPAKERQIEAYGTLWGFKSPSPELSEEWATYHHCVRNESLSASLNLADYWKGHYWFHNFMQRNPGLGMRKPEVLSAARAIGLNQQVVSQWFQIYEDLLHTLGLEGIPSHLWNCDETGLQDQFSSNKVVGQIGQSCMEVCSDNGWINADLFTEWGQLFVQSLPKGDQRPHILLLDGHSSHVYNVKFINLIISNNVHILCYPPHTTHALQPADKALFRSAHHWDKEGRKWTRLMAGQKLPKTEFFSIFNRAWMKAATVQNAQAGFRGTGMYPLNRNIIPEATFAPNKTTERILPPILPAPPSMPQTPPASSTRPESLPQAFPARPRHHQLHPADSSLPQHYPARPRHHQLHPGPRHHQHLPITRL
ncbi:hypothetical protein ACEWY4_027926 [Coilia grayii]|uniref:DDE-1 domain-containing protein n=1 Tax=Coilia grayii TaxID=363190 RepID=A0ABD1IN84_9TELE